ncbi:MAG: hypothetical protein JXA90_00605 [Planctomycetes bacterium]|nr:hypothetical protein [Planctomycetota bacterium]
MTSRQRMHIAMRRGIPDRVPVMCQLSLGHYFLNTGLPPHRIWFTSEGFAEALLALCARYRFDGILINIPGRDPGWERDVASISRAGEGELIEWRDGSRTRVPCDDNPRHEPSAPGRPPFESFDPDRDVARLDEWPAYTWGVYHTPRIAREAAGLLLDPPEHFGRTIDLVREAAGGSVSIHGEVFSPFTHFAELFGYQEALVGLLSDPARALAILDRLADAAVAWGLFQARRDVDAVLISSAFAGAGFISTEMYRRFVVPAERKVVDALHAAFPGLPVYTHTCGRLRDRLELLAETRTDGVDTLDPPPLGDTPLGEAKTRIGGRLFIKGNIDSVALLDDGPEDARRRALFTLEAGKPGGGYILSTACAVAPRVEPFKLEMLVEIAEEHGRYGEG